MQPTASRAESVLEPQAETGVLMVNPSLSKEAQWRLLIISLFVSDALMIALAFLVAFVVRFNFDLPIFRLEVEPSPRFYTRLVLTFIPVWLVVYAAVGLYRRGNLLGGTHEYALVFRGTTIGLLMVIVIGFLDPGLIIARGWVVLAWGFSFLLTSAGRFIVRRLVYGLRMRGYFLSPALLVGMNEEGWLLAEQLLSWRTSGLQIVGCVDDILAHGSPVAGGLRVLGNLDQLETLVEENRIEEIVLATSALSREQMLMIFREFGVSDAVNVRMSSGFFEIITTGLQVKEMAYVPLVSVNKVRLTGPDKLLKIILDYGLTIPAMILLAPLMLMIALVVWLESPGPVIYRRRVMGLNGRQFDAFKFRTMVADADLVLASRPDLEEEFAQNYKLKDDPRVTRLGRLLRRYSLDELPQFFNVLRSEMSLVGPRMISPEEMEKYNQWGINLLTVRPGITGLWQVSGRADVGYQERVQFDMHYIRNWTIWLDLQLILQTLPAVLRGRGAY